MTQIVMTVFMIIWSCTLLKSSRIENQGPVLLPPTQYEAHHGTEVAGATAQVEKGEARVQIQSLHHLRVDTWSRQVDVPMPPC